ncbi:hypothetical protein [Nocardiopsis quinghaiensis]|uniref:hypothetical protein n=1 Tax=Nocardiopsis quinghaiensis TaxID=464995 RepID=UPI00123B185D|nr:hypothetical protein [Nocardiopsis quinghaiensis]
MTVPASADEERRIKTVIFENTECGRCDGSGQYGPASVANGVCFSCAGKKTRLTKKGERASNETTRLLDERSSVPLSDLKEGDVIWAKASGWSGFHPIDYPYKWRQIKSISEPRVSAHSITKDEDGNEVRTPCYNVTVTFESIAGQEERTNSLGGSSPEEIMAKTYRQRTDEYREIHQGVMREIVRRFSGATAVYYEDE